MSTSKLFGKLIAEGVSSVARRQSKTLAAVERALGEQLGYSAHTIQHWRRGNVPTQMDQVADLVRYCVTNGRVDRAWARSLLSQARYPDPAALMEEIFGLEATVRRRIFMCYRRDAEPDQSVALRLSQSLSEENQVFFDQAKSVDTAQVARLDRELSESDFVVVLLSNSAIRSELVQLEIERAYQLGQQPPGRPKLLPVRLGSQAPVPEPLQTYLQSSSWAQWNDDESTSTLVEAMKIAVAGGSLPLSSAEMATRLQALPKSVSNEPAPAAAIMLETPEGTMSPDSEFYVERAADRVSLEAIARTGATITIKGPRQVGKSSLLIRIKAAAARAGKRNLLLDFQLLKPAMQDADTFFRQFCRLLGYQLQIEDETEKYWSMPLPNPFRCTEYVRRHLADATSTPLLIAMDEVDSVFDSKFRTDFFAMLRSWHNNRALDAVWKRVDMALVTSTEPYYFIDNLNQSPFNVGEVVELQPFDQDQVADLNERHGRPLSSADVARLAELLHGHPYLTRRALFLVSSGRYTAAALLENAIDENGPFGDHLRSLLVRLHYRPELVAGLRQVLATGSCSEDVFFRLRGAGLVRREGSQLLPGSELYARYLEGQLHGN